LPKQSIPPYSGRLKARLTTSCTYESEDRQEIVDERWPQTREMGYDRCAGCR
jgi:hypothetical protein